MSGSHFNFDADEALELWALGATDALDPAERAEVSAHLRRGCAECGALLAQAQARVAALGLAAAEVPPPTVARAQLMSALAAGRGTGLKPARKLPPWGWSWSWGPTAIVLGMLCLVLFGRMSGMQLSARQQQAQLARLQRQMVAVLAQAAALRRAAAIMAAPGTTALAVEATPQAPQGRAYLNRRRGAVLVAHNLPPSGPGRTYEMWLLPTSGNPRPAGTFAANAQGEAVVIYAHPLGGVAGLAVSLEPSGGSPQPTGAIVLAAKWPAP